MSNEPKAGPGLDPELLAAYVDQRLSPEQRAAVEAQLAADPDSHAVLVETMKALDDAKVQGVQPVPRVHRVRRVPWAIAGGLLAAAAALLLVVRVQPEWWVRVRGGDPQFERLVAAVGNERYLEARLSGGFNHGPLRQTTRGAGDLANQNLALLAAAGELQRRAQLLPDIDNLHSWGVAQVLLGDVDSAIRDLQQAASLGAQSSALLADLAAAYQARAAARGSEEDWSRSLDSSERAINLDRNQAEAWFTRALAIEHLGLDAARAWNDYLQIDATSPWAEEARARLARLQQKPISRQETELDLAIRTAVADLDPARLDTITAAAPGRVRTYLEERLSAEWAEALLSESRSDYATAQRRLSTLSAAYGRHSLDQLPADLARELAGQTFERASRPFARAVKSFAEAAAYVRDDRPNDSERVILQIRPALQSSVLRYWADYFLALSQSQRGQLPAALSTLAQLRSVCEARSYFALCGIVINRQGQIHSRQGDRQQALVDRRDALQALNSARDEDQIAVIHSMMAESYRNLADPSTAWDHHGDALRRLPAVHDFRSRHLVLAQAGLTSAVQGLHAAAFRFHEAVVINGRAWKRASGISSGLLQSARSLARSGQIESARQQIKVAREFLADIPDADIRERFDLEILEVEGELFGGLKPEEGIPALDRAIDRFEQTGFGIRLGRLLLSRGRLHLARGDINAAEQDWLRGIDRLEHERLNLNQEQLRLSQANSLRELRLRFALLKRQRQEPPLSVLAVIDQSHAQTLAEQAAGQEPRADSVEVLQHALASGQGVLYFVTAATPPLSYLLTRQGVIERPLPVTNDELSKLLGEYSRAIDGRQPEAGLLFVSEKLHNALLGGLQKELAELDSLVVVPDTRVTRVSFAALRDPASKKYLIEQLMVAVAPSAAVLVQAPAESINEAKVIVAAGETHGAGSLPALPWVDTEVQAIATLYGPRVIAGHMSTADFLRQLPSARIVHFAGHALANPAQPLQSRLLFDARHPNRDLYAFEISSGPRLNAALVVLAACRTGHSGGESADDDAVLALARPFLARGAKAVLASLWDVSDRHSATLMTDLHRRIAADVPPAAAWRASVLEMIHRAEPVGSWAAYTLYLGSGALSARSRGSETTH